MAILPSANNWTTATMFDTAPNLSAKGDENFGNWANWGFSGSLTGAALASDTCSFWTVNTAPATGRYGVAGFTPLSLFLGTGSAIACNFTSATITCLQQ
jgi:hypothetical protein